MTGLGKVIILIHVTCMNLLTHPHYEVSNTHNYHYDEEEKEAGGVFMAN